MSGNTFGRLFRLTTFGESHGPAVGGVLDGCPAGLPLTAEDIQEDLDKRRPGHDAGAAGTTRREADRVRLLSGVFAGKTTGTPIAFVVENTSQRSGDYDELARIFRPGHADLGFYAKFGLRDHRGGGRSSGRETLARVAGGAVARLFLARLGIAVKAWTVELGGIPAFAPGAFAAGVPAAGPDASADAASPDIAGLGEYPYFAPDAASAARWDERVRAVRERGDSLGGLVRLEARGVPAGLGEPVFDKLDARLAYALMGVGAVKGVEIGGGFASARLTGGENNDPLLPAPKKNKEASGPGDASAGGPLARPASAAGAFIPAAAPLPGGAAYGFASNNAGGVLGGLSSGAPLVVTVAVKPISSIRMEQRSITIEGEAARLRVGGRHDVCAIPRIVPVLRAMICLTLADFVLLQQRQGKG